MALQLSKKRALETPAIPDRLYFKIGDVARICGVETYVLRFWESQFPQLKPNKSGTGQRLYRKRDVELALKIKQLVHLEGYTLAGARQVLQQSQSSRPAPIPEPEPTSPAGPQLLTPTPVAIPAIRPPEKATSALEQIRAELRELASLLASPAPEQPQAPPQPQAQPRRRTRPAPEAASDTLFPM